MENTWHGRFLLLFSSSTFVAVLENLEKTFVDDFQLYSY